MRDGAVGIALREAKGAWSKWAHRLGTPVHLHCTSAVKIESKTVYCMAKRGGGKRRGEEMAGRLEGWRAKSRHREREHWVERVFQRGGERQNGEECMVNGK
jgi:hypothetical protein